jgi:hypothetical protein
LLENLAKQITDLEAAKTVDDMITALPAIASLALTDKTAVAAARTAYDALSATQQGYVSKLAVLTAAEAKIADLIAAQAVDDKIAALHGYRRSNAGKPGSGHRGPQRLCSPE